MIKNIGVENFKCFSKVELNFAKANILLGANSSGKSSIIQAILLADMFDGQSFNNKIDLITNSYKILFYSFTELLNRNSYKDFFKITLNNNEYIIKTEDGTNNVITCDTKQIHTTRKNTMLYLGANRELDAEQIIGNYDNIMLGEKNEYIAFIIEAGQKNKIEIYKERNIWTNKDGVLLDIQINEWLNFIFPQNSVTANRNGTSHYLNLLFNKKMNLHSTNIGYGISYVLPIIIASLIIEKEGVLVIENPEIHLHPRAQSCLGMFLGHIASSGVQLIIETHSEHIINGLRKSILMKEHQLKKEDLTIFYFNCDGENKVEEIKLDENAEIKYWPKGFMDQEEQDLFELRRLRKNKS